MCSTFKTYAVARVMQLVEGGQRSLDTLERINASDIVENSPPSPAPRGSLDAP